VSASGQTRQVQTPTGRCAISGRTIGEGEPFYAVLFEEGDSFRREDYSLESWTGPPQGSYCTFKTRMPVREKKKKLYVDDDVLIDFFLRLESDHDPVRVQFRFVLGLILMRKRLLRFDRGANHDGREIWQMTLIRDKSEHRLVNPELSDDQIDAVSRQLGAILQGDYARENGMNEVSDSTDRPDGESS
jgi:hypothetical protein